MKLILGDCLDKLKELDDNSIDSIVTDPPYGLAFMGKRWDYDVPSQDIWEECLRVLKPGGYLLSFAGSRTYHRMAVRIEDAGFEIRDQIMWVYGSGFPKSMDISKQIDKREGAEREVVGSRVDAFGDAELSETDDGRNLWGKQSTKEVPVFSNTATSDLAKQWEGWGTALKPAHEPIVMARKPFRGAVVDNVLEWGTGGINIDESRIGTDETLSIGSGKVGYLYKTDGSNKGEQHIAGRFPANIIFDEEAGRMLDEQSGVKHGNNKGAYTYKDNEYKVEGFINNVKPNSPSNYGDTGGASRFFYCPKTSKTDRNEGLEDFEDKLTQGMRANAGPALVGDDESGRTTAKNNHPTVKPTDLMLYLIRLVTPRGGTTLDPFMGSGSTGKGAVRGGFDFVGIEREQEYFEIAEARIEYERDNPYDEKSGKRVKINKHSNGFWE